MSKFGFRFRRPDGGEASGVHFYGFEWKGGFSIGLLHFEPGGRDAFHTHAFNAWTWWLSGIVEEQHTNGRRDVWTPSIVPKRTLRSTFHRVVAGIRGAWALTLRGPWVDVWVERKAGETTKLTHGRVRL